MASYRPKSLDELNSLYDKSLNAKNEIEKKALGFEIRKEQQPSAPVENSNDSQENKREQAATEQIAGLVDDFIKSFGAPVPVKKVQPTSVAAASVKAVSPAKPVEEKKPEEAPASYGAAGSLYDRPKLIRNSERNDLFEDYKKVMDDEDDYEYAHHKRLRKRGKKRSEKKAASIIEQEQDQLEVAAEPEIEQEAAPIYEEPVLEQDLSEEQTEPYYEILQPEQEAEQELEEYAAEEYVAEEQYAPEEEYAAEELYIAQEEAEQETDVDKEPQTEINPSYQQLYTDEQQSFEEAYAEEEEAEQEVVISEPAPKKKSAGKNLLLLLLFFVILFASAISAVKAFSGINTDNLFLGKYHLYSAQSDFLQADIKSGDLVVINHKAVNEGDVFAHKKSEGEYAFSKLDSVLNEEAIVADNDGQKTIVFKNSVRGVFEKSYPAIGAIAAAVMSDYLYILGALMALALVLVLVIVFVFGDKKEKVKKEKPKKEKAKKAKKEKQTEEEVNEEAYGSEEYDTERYEDVEKDFRYLIQDDDFDSYREDSAEEGLPVYQPLDDYKYEPDEYVTK